jgi:hypothetical protein
LGYDKTKTPPRYSPGGVGFLKPVIGGLSLPIPLHPPDSAPLRANRALTC